MTFDVYKRRYLMKSVLVEIKDYVNSSNLTTRERSQNNSSYNYNLDLIFRALACAHQRESNEEKAHANGIICIIAALPL